MYAKLDNEVWIKIVDIIIHTFICFSEYPYHLSTALYIVESGHNTPLFYISPFHEYNYSERQKFLFLAFAAPIFAACKRRIYLAKIVRIPRRGIVKDKLFCRSL